MLSAKAKTRQLLCGSRDMRLETARHPSRKWSGTYLGSLVSSVILFIKITSVNFFVFGRKVLHSHVILNIKTNRFFAHG